MSMKPQELFVGGASDARGPPPSFAASSEVRQVGGRASCMPAGSSRLRVLVVDDHRDAADSLSALVEMWGHAVRQAYDGADALEIAAAFQPDVLLLDVAMPKVDGCQLARLLRRQACFTHALLIAITGYADEAHRVLCAEAGFDQWLVKPVEPSLVEGLLRMEKDRLDESPEAPQAVPREERTPRLNGPRLMTRD